MKLSQDTTHELMLCIEARLNQINEGTQSQFIKDSLMMDVSMMCSELGLKEKAEDIAKDAGFIEEQESESNQDPNEDRDNDVEWNNRPNQFI